MKDAVLQRVKELIEYKNVSINAFSKLISIEQTTLNNQIIGKRALSLDVILSIIDLIPEVSAEWLLRGEGSMLKPHHDSTYNINNDSECLGASSCPIDDTARGLALYDQLERDTFLAQLDAIIERKINARLERMLNVG